MKSYLELHQPFSCPKQVRSLQRQIRKKKNYLIYKSHDNCMITHNSVITHSHKKQKESLEARAEVAVLHTYVENQAILEPILLY